MFLVAVQIDPSTDIKLKNVVLVMQLALFLQVLHLHSTKVAKNKLLWAKLMSGFTCFILFLDLNS